MTVEQGTKIDFIGTCNEAGTVMLAIADHLPWEMSGHLLLQEKINSCIAFVESGQFSENDPQAKDRPVRFDLVTKFGPGTSSRAFFEEAGKVLNGIKSASGKRPRLNDRAIGMTEPEQG